MKHPKTAKELARFSISYLTNLPFPINDLRILLICRDVLNNPKAFREDDMRTGDIVFYERI